MAEKFATVEETLAYVTAASKANTDPRYLTEGSKNFLIDRQRKASIRRGTKRLGSGSVVESPPKNDEKWVTSTGREWKVDNVGTNLRVYIDTIDGVTFNDFFNIKTNFGADEIIRFQPNWWKDSESLDVIQMVAGDPNIYEWSGGVAVVESVGATTITKKGTGTFGQARFYANANRTLINVRTGTEFTYTGGLGTDTLTGVGGGSTAELVENDILVQKVVTYTNEPAASRNNHTIGMTDNNLLIGSFDDNEVFMTANDDPTDTSFSSPRVAGEGGIFTLDGPSRGFGKVGTTLVLFSGDDSIFRVKFKEVAVSTTLAEIIDVKKILAGARQGSYGPDTIVQLGNAIMYLSNEPAWRYIQDPETLEGLSPVTLSNPIKPDFDAENWTNSHARWHKNAVYLTAPTNGRLFILEFVEDADGQSRRFWQPPQILSIRTLVDYGNKLYGGSNAVSETYELFADDTYSDMIPSATYGDPDGKVAIDAVAAYAYTDHGDRARLKKFDEYFVEGEIRSNTIVQHTVYYDFGGATDSQINSIDGGNSDILEQTLINSSLGQQPLGQTPLGGSLQAPDDAAAFAVIFEHPPEDYRKIQSVFSVSQIDAYFSIIAHGPNAELSRRRNVTIKI